MTKKNSRFGKIALLIGALVVAGVGYVMFFAGESREEMTFGGRYQPYEAIESILADVKKPVVLFFHASWCPSCRATHKNLVSSLESMGSDFLIANVDYDSSRELKTKHGVTSQHTFVLLDMSGNEVAKVQGLNSYAEIENFVKQNITMSPLMQKDESEYSCETNGSCEAPNQAVLEEGAPAVLPTVEDIREQQTEQNQVSVNNEVAIEKAQYITFTETDNLSELPGDGPVVMFFYAGRCGSCQNTDKNIRDNLASLQQDLTILKVDYDTQMALRQKYGITMQHTFVLVDRVGRERKKQNGLRTLNDIVGFAMK